MDSPSIGSWGLLEAFSIPETKCILSSTDIWSFQLIVDAVFSRTEVGKAARSLRKDTFLEKSLPVVTLGVVGVLESEPMFSFSLSLEEDTAIALGEIFLEAEKTETLLEEYLTI